MTFLHRIKLIFARFNWWLRITEKAKDHYEALEDYYYLYDLYNQATVSYLEEHKKKPEGELTLKLKGQVELLAEIVDIKQ